MFLVSLSLLLSLSHITDLMFILCIFMTVEQLKCLCLCFYPKQLTNEDITLQLASKLTISYIEGNHQSDSVRGDRGDCWSAMSVCKQSLYCACVVVVFPVIVFNKVSGTSLEASECSAQSQVQYVSCFS